MPAFIRGNTVCVLRMKLIVLVENKLSWSYMWSYMCTPSLPNIVGRTLSLRIETDFLLTHTHTSIHRATVKGAIGCRNTESTVRAFVCPSAT